MEATNSSKLYQEIDMQIQLIKIVVLCEGIGSLQFGNITLGLTPL